MSSSTDSTISSQSSVEPHRLKTISSEGYVGCDENAMETYVHTYFEEKTAESVDPRTYVIFLMPVNLCFEEQCYII